MAEDIYDKLIEMAQEAQQIRSATRPNLPDAEVQDLQRRAQAIGITLATELERLYPNRDQDTLQRIKYDYDLDRVSRFLEEQVLPLRVDLAGMRNVQRPAQQQGPLPRGKGPDTPPPTKGIRP